MCPGVVSVRVTLPNSAAGQAATTPVVVFCGNGFPPLTPKGPKAVRAASDCDPGKHVANVANPAGVGVMPALVKKLLVLMISVLKPPATNSRFLTTGPT